MNSSMAAMPEQADLAIIGGGFSGIMLLVQVLLQPSATPRRITLFHRGDLARGPAYATRDPHHLLNVPARNMSAFADAPDHFLAWLASNAASQHFAPEDFVPRCMYGDYLTEILQHALAATPHQVNILEEEVTSIAPQQDSEALMITTARYQLVAAQVVLALGSEPAAVPPGGLSPWALRDHPLPPDGETIRILGAGLTAVDAYLSLRGRGFTGRITMASPSGRLPQAHRPNPISYRWRLPLPTGLSALLQAIRRAAEELGDWRAVVDGLRPHTLAFWRSLSPFAQTLFLTQYFGLWNIHRHRMAPQIAAQLAADSNLTVTALARASHPLPPARLTIHCTGQNYRIHATRNRLLRQLLDDGLITAHATGFGIRADGYRCWGSSARLFALGALLIGERLETTAVPELRVEAAELAALLGR
jgi:uncharacterized NAD(P)/FAD-binding protein YdhS